MEKRIGSMYRVDCTLIVLSIAFLWMVLLGVMSAVASLDASRTVVAIALGSGAVAGGTATISLIALLHHLKKNKQDIYAQDILCSGFSKID